ncbi:ABC-three component system protein [Pseudomonas syringae]|uniref:ABC-three component system protein n=1 Tax=Pseudomonas syringae TaxID=317 RepID=UPI001F0E191F|nr:ABC-three component system protein [Pseudomonas syringae]MCH5514100.1 serine protease [Pseudomonas syringae pv. syringae]MCH5628074.1 serine protease [Pseudomonas syringae pv. syringae]
MTISEQIDSYCVKVNEGSGVLVNAMSKEYSYVLTAGHALRENAADNIVTDYEGNLLEVIEVLVHSDEKHRVDYDCGIIKVAYMPRVTQQASSASSLSIGAHLVLTGFPATERKSLIPIKHYDGHMTSSVRDLIIFTVEGIPGKGTIAGMSGGGVYHIEENRPYLIGVEYSMDGTGSDQQFGRIQCQGLVRFEEIISSHASAPMVPAHLECFSRLRKNIFGFNVIDQQNIVRLRNELFKFADDLVARGMPAPYELMEKYENDLLVGTGRAGEVRDRELWVAYFEFLVICALLDGVGTVDETYIKSLERKRRILYTSDGSNWVGRLEIILKTARKLLDQNGTVIVASPEQGADLLPDGFHIDRIVKNIALVPDSGPLAPIDQAESELYKSFILAHLEGIRKQCVVRGEMEYSDTDAGVAQLHLFRVKLNEFVK